MSHEVKNKCREMTGLINYHHVKLLHVVILDLKGVVPTIYQNFFLNNWYFTSCRRLEAKNSSSFDFNDKRKKKNDETKV